MAGSLKDLRLSIVVPAHNAALHLPFCLDAIAHSDLPRDQWELIVVDDASTDATPSFAAAADQTLRTGERPRGPAYARNRGAAAASGEILAFVDADVAVHRESLRLLVDRLTSDPGLVAVFGAYDEEPSDPALISRYRNLLHHYAHRTNAGEVPTFWAGCGAVRAAVFREVGGFDEVLYDKPQIEDIELGYRLVQKGRILLDPLIQAKHYKKWLFWPMIRTDFRDRAVPWVRLLLAMRRTQRSSAPSLGPQALIATAVAGAAAGAAVLGIAGLGAPAYIGAAALFVLSVFLNRDLYLWLRQRGGLRLALAAVPLHFVYQLLIADAECADQSSRRDIGIELPQQFARLAIHRGLVQNAQTPLGFSSQEDVCRNA